MFIIITAPVNKPGKRNRFKGCLYRINTEGCHNKKRRIRNNNKFTNKE